MTMKKLSFLFLLALLPLLASAYDAEIRGIYYDFNLRSKTASVTSGNMDIYQAKKFKKTDDGYHCYYVYWIRHLDNYDNTNMGVMEFAVVRNNLYRMIITQVSGLGDSDIPTAPDKPDEGETYLKVILNVKPWIVRDLTNIVL